MGEDDEEAHCCRIEESSIINIIITCDISIYSSSYIVNCADKYKLQITNWPVTHAARVTHVLKILSSQLASWEQCKSFDIIIHT